MPYSDLWLVIKNTVYAILIVGRIVVVEYKSVCVRNWHLAHVEDLRDLGGEDISERGLFR